ncbi:MAG: 1-acyl-sn-glycerol-3-phosphate acyltransferase [Chlamydiales bacterium]|nr:1-acyl-sn-glycerol-3-phosphate acyltransferase [Chlamydiales bacterium]
MRLRKSKLFYRFIISIARLFFKLFYKVEVFGLEHFEKGGAIIAANHASYLDPLLIAVTAPEEIHFLAKASLFKIPLIGSIIKALNTHPLRGSVKDVHTFRDIQELIDKDYKVLLFPEGTRGFSDDIGPMKRGVALLFAKTRCKIIPLYIHGTFDAWSREHTFPRFRKKLVCVFGRAIHWEEFSHLDPKDAQGELIQRIESALRSLKQSVETNSGKFEP